MQPYVTPHPGRTPPEANIVNRSDYKLDFTVSEFRTGEYVLTIDSFIPEHGWISKQYFLDAAELARVQAVINAPK
jgi:hypothetical protein